MSRQSSPRFPAAAVCDLANWPLHDKPFDQLRASEPQLLKRGIRINVVAFASELGLVWGIAFFPASQQRPTNEQVQRIYESLGAPLPAIPEAGKSDKKLAKAHTGGVK